MKSELKVLREIEQEKYQTIATFENIILEIYGLEHDIEWVDLGLSLKRIMPVEELKSIFIHRHRTMLNESDIAYLEAL